MRKIYTNTMMVLMLALTMMTFTSCDKDTMLAWDLDGLWSGTIIGDYYYDRYHSREAVFDTEIRFDQNGEFSRGGTGYQVDYYNRKVYSEYYFDWKVRDQRIFIYYKDGYDVVIRDYELYDVGSTTHFRGYFDDAYDGTPAASFDLVKIGKMRSAVNDEGVQETSKEESK